MGKKHLLMAAAAGAMTLGVASAQAADVEPVAAPAEWYVSLFGGASFLEDVSTEYDNDGPETYDIDAQTDVGFIIGGAIGTHLTEDLRVELEVAYSENDVDGIHYSGPKGSGSYDGEGSFGILTFMGNLWYDAPLDMELKPYIGGGLGVAIVDADSVGYANPDFEEYDSSEVAFAFQVGAGLRWMMSDNITLDVGYRLRGIDGPTFEPGEDGDDNDADLILSHNIIAGVTVGF